MADREYCVLPDGSIFWLDQPEDFVEAREIAKDEAGDIIVAGSIVHPKPVGHD